jgi:hypothetical protein
MSSLLLPIATADPSRLRRINLPIGALALAVIAFCLPLKAVHGDIKKKLMQIDYGGAVLTLGGTTLILLPINWGGTSFAWSSPTVIGCLCGGVATFVSQS